MARQISSRITVKGILVTRSPLHVGGMGYNDEVDLTLAVNGQGQYYIPGTSLAGCLRAWMNETDPAQAEIVGQLWGPRLQRDNTQGHASFLVVADAPIASDRVREEIRDGVGIDRLTGTAAEQLKFTRAVLPRETHIPLHLKLDVQAQHQKSHPGLLKLLLQALQSGDIQLGAAKTRGLGQVKLTECKIQQDSFSTPGGILQAIKQTPNLCSIEDLPNPPSSLKLAPKLWIEIDWQPLGPVMVKAEAEGIAVDMLPLTTAIGDQLTFVIPGSSIKGSLRSQAERILRTLLQSTDIPEGKGTGFIQQLQVELVQHLFGFANQNRQEGEGYAGCLGVSDCYASTTFTPQQWEKVQNATTVTDLSQVLDNTSAFKQTQQAFHVAIDRWTGGAADHFLYSTLEPIGVRWNPIQLTVHLQRLPEPLPAIALLMLLLRDLSTGRIPLGYGSNRGMGSVQINHIKIRGVGLGSELAYFRQVTLPQGDITKLKSSLLKTLQQAWTAWLQAKIS